MLYYNNIFFHVCKLLKAGFFKKSAILFHVILIVVVFVTYLFILY